MRNYICQIKTVPLPEEELMKVMPLEIKFPMMPRELKELPQVDYTKCPKYGGDVERQKEWMVEKAEVALQKQAQARDEWEENAIDAKQRFFDEAALNAQTGQVKLIALRDVESKTTHLLVNGGIGNTEGTALPAVSGESFENEKSLLSDFAGNLNSGYVLTGNDDNQSDFHLVTFYGNYFDFPFLFRRCWITGALAPIVMTRENSLRKSPVAIDLLDVWQMGDRQAKVGGLDGLARMLGTKHKSGQQEGFYRTWQKDPVKAINDVLEELDMIEEAAVKMGVVYLPREQ